MKLVINKSLSLFFILLSFIFLSSCGTQYGIGLPGHLVWKTFISNIEGVKSSPAVIDGKVYVGSGYPGDALGISRGSINCIDANTGWFIWRKIFRPFLGNSSDANDTPVVSNGVLYFHDGAYNANTGEELWSFKLEPVPWLDALCLPGEKQSERKYRSRI